MKKGLKYKIIVDNQMVDAEFIREYWTIFGKRYEFNVSIKFIYIDGHHADWFEVKKVRKNQILGES